MKGYKAFNKDWTSKKGNFKYEVGKTYETQENLVMCEKGFHFCINSCDVLNYYPEADCKYAVIEAEGKIQTEEDKSVCSKITIVKEISKNELLQAHKEIIGKPSTTGDRAHSSTTGDYAHSSTTGDWAHSSTTGNRAHSSTTGDWAHSSTTGDEAHSSTTGYRAHSSTTGYRAHSSTTGNSANSSTTGDWAHSCTTGYRANSSTTGDWAHSSTTGDYAHSSTEGENSISISCGIKSKAKATKGFIFIVDWRLKNNDWYIHKTYTARVGEEILGKTIKPNYWYWFEYGKLMEEKAE